ncbi:MAG: ATP-binding protein [Candidatus Thorarchaeota archaeon]
MTSLLDGLETTAGISVGNDPFEMIVGQEHAVTLVRSAVTQRRHVLLCGAPGVGKSMLAKAAHSLLPPPAEEIVLRHNPNQVDRPEVVVVRASENRVPSDVREQPSDIMYMRPHEIPFEVAAEMGYRCPKCGSFSLPSHSTCMECGAAKRADMNCGASFHGLFRMLDVVRAPALTEVSHQESVNGVGYEIVYERTDSDTIKVTRFRKNIQRHHRTNLEDNDWRVLVPGSSTRFVRVSGASPVELLGDVKHDPYGTAEPMGKPAHLRVVPGAIHEAHEGILYIDELNALGHLQKHLLTAMQDKKYPITGHNPQSSGAAVRVDDVPCDFVLFAACNVEDLPSILPPLRSRIRGYGYEIMLSSWMKKSTENLDSLVRFIAQTVVEDSRIPHLTVDAVRSVLENAENVAFRLDGQRNALTLRLRELGGLVRVAGDLAVHEGHDAVHKEQVERAKEVTRGFDADSIHSLYMKQAEKPHESYGDYFF